MNSADTRPESHKFGRNRPPLWEEIVAGAGLVMFVALLGYLLYHALAGDHSPPNVEVEMIEIRASGDDFLVTFKALNHGGETASGVVVSGYLERDGTVLETAETTLDFIPAESSRRGGLFFRQDPREADLWLMPSGYALP